MLSAARSSLRATRTGALRFPRLEPLVRFQSTGATRPDYTSILVSQPAEGVSQITLNRPKALNGSSTSPAREEERAFHLTAPPRTRTHSAQLDPVPRAQRRPPLLLHRRLGPMRRPDRVRKGLCGRRRHQRDEGQAVCRGVQGRLSRPLDRTQSVQETDRSRRQWICREFPASLLHWPLFSALLRRQSLTVLLPGDRRAQLGGGCELAMMCVVHTLRFRECG